ncbi:MAG: ATP-binding protein, partial [Syntrophobacteraceae bacterium]|nr:ATP-binding protein [Syntrophobacteraceae bacterium]
MLKRIYIDNFRCLVNFELTLNALHLFLGPNGSGKSSVFDVLWKIQSLANGDWKVDQLFPASERTRWQKSTLQQFELELEGNGGTYKYELAIDHDPERLKNRVKHERLWFDGKPLLKVELGEVHLRAAHHRILEQLRRRETGIDLEDLAQDRAALLAVALAEQ